MDLFAKIEGLELVDMLRNTGLYPFFRKLQGSRGNNVVHNDRDLVMMGSNNYLGLTHDPRVIEAAVDAVRKWGAGCTGSRFLNGNLALHEELEKELAAFFGFEDALVFATGFMANSGAIGALVGPQDYILSDKENHACIIEGCMLTKANFVVYRHSDMEHLEKKLKAIPLDAGKLIITDGVFSMTGHLAHYNKIHELAKKYNARTYIDDAHGLGVVGPGGRGTAAHFGLPTDLLMGTFSKSLASQGGFICADARVIDWLKHKARTFMFSAALAPASAAAALKALQILKEEPQRVDQVKANAAYLKQAFDAAGLNTLGTETCVVPVFIGDDETALGACEELLKLGVFTTPVLYPAVRKGQAMIRCSVMATHTKEDLDTAIHAFTQLAPVIRKANANPNMKALSDRMNIRSTPIVEAPIDETVVRVYILFLACASQASVSDSDIQNSIGDHLNKIQTASSWKEFVRAKPEEFPKDLKTPVVLVDKMTLDLKGETFTLGLGYRQFFMKTTMGRAKQIMNSPDLWKNLFGLDAEARVGEMGETFRARVFKKVPVLSDQDYTLEFKNFEDQGVWFQRAKQTEDKKQFALRDNLKTLEAVDGGVVFREVSVVYILRWYLRALGPQVRSVMEKELAKLNTSVKCVAESEKPVAAELADECFKVAEKAH